MTAQIIALGGGGFSEATEPELDQYLLDQAPAGRPRIGFIATASGDAESYLLKFYARFSQLNCEPSHLPLFRRTPDIATWLHGQDVIFVGGGNTRSMLSTWATWNLPGLLRTALDHGKVLGGVSAGAICWFDSGITDSVAGRLTPIDCMGFLNGSCCPHYRLEEERRPEYHRMIEAGEIGPGYAIDDGAAVHFVDGVAVRVINGPDGASAWRVDNSPDEAVVTRIAGAEYVDPGTRPR